MRVALRFLVRVVLPAAVAIGSASAAAAAVEPAVCLECHADQALLSGPHGRADEVSCESCHGDGQAHVEDGEPIFSFDPSHGRAEKTAVCLDCHAGTHPRFESSDHARAGLDCASCHGVHGPAREADLTLVDLAGRSSATCAGCHTAVATEFTFNERHRLVEGALECSDCHDPHVASLRPTLGGFKQEACAACHVDKGGPFVFEHAAGRVEGCVSCHSPHGSPNRHLLQNENEADQCYSCHAFVPGFHSNFEPDVQCTACHSSIHGSHIDRHFLR